MYTILKIVSLIFQIIPRKMALLLGRMLGLFISYFFPLRKSVALINLGIAFPDWSISKKKSLLRSCYIHYGMVLIDFFRLTKVKNKKNKIIVNIPKKSIELFNSNKGGIILSAHIGNWEYIGPILGINNIKCAGVAKIQKNSKSNLFFNHLRKSKNVIIIPMDAGSKTMIKIINDGHYLGLISDQNAGKRGTSANFFNQPISVPKGAAAFHLKTNTPILFGFCILRKDLNYDLSFHELDVSSLPQNSDEAIVEINRRFTKVLERTVKEHPVQYFWFHRKWNRKIYKTI